MLVAARGLPHWKTVVLIVLAMVAARTAAMAFNRLADWEIDKRNPRTAGRHKLISKNAGYALLLVSSLAFIACSYGLNTICLALSPVALAIVFFYSLTKRFTAYSHFFLGFALGASPVAAWLAVRGEFALAPFALAAAVLFWVAGFDIIYATQDHEFDRAEGLHSLVVRLGVQKSLLLAQRLHVGMIFGLVYFGHLVNFGAVWLAAWMTVLGAVIYEHYSAARLDIAGINRAFFTSNAFVSVVILVAAIVETMILR